jgi:anhydro-N-acetylmuramic acid kinase
MSGTSMDGIDAALVCISGPASQPRVRLVAFETFPYPPLVRQTALRIATGDSTTAGEISRLNFHLGELFAKAALGVCRKARISPRRLVAIGSHGQTIYHQGMAAASAPLPDKPRGSSGTKAAELTNRSALLKSACTLQIAEPAVIAERTRTTVVADFRTADMAAGGQGAPLVPMVDYLLLRNARQGTVALNIGGIANFTVIPAAATPEQVLGFDTGPGNMIIDGLVRYFTGGGKSYDAGGRWAARGRVIEPLLDELLRLPFFSQQPPKSAGREQFGQPFVERFFLLPDPALRRPQAGQIANLKSQIANHPQDLLRTATEFTVRTIAGALQQFVLKKFAIHRLIFSGGGAHNDLLVARLSELLPTLRLHASDEFGLGVDSKEAIAFAVLADRTLHSLPGNIPSVTGARRAVVLGKVSRP